MEYRHLTHRLCLPTEYLGRRTPYPSGHSWAQCSQKRLCLADLRPNVLGVPGDPLFQESKNPLPGDSGSGAAVALDPVTGHEQLTCDPAAPPGDFLHWLYLS